MMAFDPYAALAEIQNQPCPPATPATPATRASEAAPDKGENPSISATYANLENKPGEVATPATLATREGTEAGRVAEVATPATREAENPEIGQGSYAIENATQSPDQRGSQKGRVAEVAGLAGLAAPHAEILTLAFDHFEERAAIREHEAGQSRRRAEREALTEAAEAFGINTQSLQDHLTKSKA